MQQGSTGITRPIRLSGGDAHVALLLMNVPPAISTNVSLPRVAITPPDSSALLFLNIPPSIVNVVGPPLPSPNIYCKKKEEGFRQGRGSHMIALQGFDFLKKRKCWPSKIDEYFSRRTCDT